MTNEPKPRRHRIADIDISGIGDVLELVWHVVKFLVRVVLEILACL